MKCFNMQGRWLYHNRLNKKGRKCRKIHMRSEKKCRKQK